ncbi:MAG: hypothetical protein LBB73_05220 [Dysgonamonadaceae bacterium]|jgi:hypothetical protein|nr:hypothetical protein [Dysgonamonadaceae bacterium]
MADNTMNYDRFNTSVRGWAMATRRGMVTNARDKVKHEKKDSKKRKAPKLAKSISVGFRKSYGAISRINFLFARHGEFIHYGVGRGYIRTGNTIKRGRRYAGDEIGLLLHRGYTRREIDKMRHRCEDEKTAGRIPVDWFDVEIRRGMQWLADYTGDFYGDKAMNAILEKMDKPLPVFSKHVKVKTKQ